MTRFKPTISLTARDLTIASSARGSPRCPLTVTAPSPLYCASQVMPDRRNTSATSWAIEAPERDVTAADAVAWPAPPCADCPGTPRERARTANTVATIAATTAAVTINGRRLSICDTDCALDGGAFAGGGSFAFTSGGASTGGG